MHLLALAISFPAVIFTVLLGVVLIYWVMVIVGAASVDALGDGAADAAIDGAADAVGGHDLGDVGHDGALDAAHAHGALSGLLHALRLRAAPATVVMSCIVVFAWVLTMLGMEAAEALLPASMLVLAKIVLLVLAPIVALFPTSLALRPLAPIFSVPRAAAHADLVGKLCTVRTGTVTERFGEAMVGDGGAGVVVRVRVAAGDTLARGEQAVIVGYDEERQEFTVAPLSAADEVLDADRRARRDSK